MSTLQISVERELPCECLALVSQPFPACPQCDGTGLSDQEVTVDVEYEYQRACRGAVDRLFGGPLEPDQYADVGISETSLPLTENEQRLAAEMATGREDEEFWCSVADGE